jgi:hypothetical protein
MTQFASRAKITGAGAISPGNANFAQATKIDERITVNNGDSRYPKISTPMRMIPSLRIGTARQPKLGQHQV